MARFQHDALVEVTEDLEQSILDAAHWPNVLERMSRATGSRGAAFIRADEVSAAALSTPSLDAVSERYFAQGWYKNDHRRAGIPIMRERGVMVDQDFTTPEQIERLPYYQQFLAPLGLRWFAGIGFQTDAAYWCVSIQRTVDQGYFEQDERRSLLAFYPTLRRAAFLTSTVERARLAAMADTFDVIGRPAAILGSDGRVIRWNDAFEALLDADLRIVHGRITTNQTEVNAQFEGLSRAYGRPPISVIAVRRPTKPVLVIHVLPLVGETRGLFAAGTTLLVANTPDRGSAAAGPSLQLIYGLSKTEARLAVALSEGASAAEAALRFGVTYHTVRSQVRTIFEKTGVTRQVDLARLVLGLSPPR